MIGKLHKYDMGRDAVHVAILSVQASMVLQPGWDIGLDANGKATRSGDTIGIVDPFLSNSVQPDEWFGLWLYPGSTVGLTHCYKHPALDGKAAAERIKKFATDIGYDYVELMDAAREYCETGWHTTDNDQRYSNVKAYQWTAFWEDFKLVEPECQVDEDSYAPFSCSCG